MDVVIEAVKKYPLPKTTERYGNTLIQRLSHDERDMLYEYSTSNYYLINRYLYKQPATSSTSYMQTMNAKTRLLDGIFEKSSLPHAMIVYRGLDAYRAGFCGDNYADPDIARAVGKIYTFNGYVSTSISQFHAGLFMSMAGGNHAILQMHLPAGTHAIPMVGELTAYPNEQEVLLPRNSRIKLQKIVREQRDDFKEHVPSPYYRIYGELIT